MRFTIAIEVLDQLEKVLLVSWYSSFIGDSKKMGNLQRVRERGRSMKGCYLDAKVVEIKR